MIHFRFTQLFVLLISTLFFSSARAASLSAPAPTETRCGWYFTSAGQSSVRDATASWEIYHQGEKGASGAQPPDFEIEDVRYFLSSGQSGAGSACVCLTGLFDAKHKRVASIKSWKRNLISVCESDSKLPFFEKKTLGAPILDQKIYGNYLVKNEDCAANSKVSIDGSHMYLMTQGAARFKVRKTSPNDTWLAIDSDASNYEEKFVRVIPKNKNADLTLEFHAQLEDGLTPAMSCELTKSK